MDEAFKVTKCEGGVAVATLSKLLTLDLKLTTILCGGYYKKVINLPNVTLFSA